jgi:hypothetical protein
MTCRSLFTPEILEPRRRQLGIAYRMLNIAVPKVSLQRPRIVSLVSQRVAAGVAQHVRVCLEPKLGHDPRPLDHAGKAGRAERRPALGGEDEGALRLLRAL